MKKRICFLLAALLLAVFAASAEQAAPLTEEDFVFVYGETEARFGDSPAALLAAMEAHDGAPVETDEADSCLYDTKDYEYSGLEITVGSCHPHGGPDEVINAVIVWDGEWKTARGVGIGDTVEAVAAAYGEGFAEADTLVYALGDRYLTPTLVFQLDMETGEVISFCLLACFGE